MMQTVVQVIISMAAKALNNHVLQDTDVRY